MWKNLEITKKIILCLTLISGHVAMASVFPFEANCKKTILKTLPELKIYKKWHQNKSPVGEFYRRKENGVGFWYKLWRNHNVIYISRLTPHTESLYSFGSKCLIKVSHKAFKFNGEFDDEKLSNKMKVNERGLIYIWSPGMPISYHGIDEMKKIAKELNLALDIILDPHINDSIKRGWLKKAKMSPEDLLRNHSRELVERGAGLHYPMLFIYQDGKLIKNGYPGYDIKKFNKITIQSILKNGIKDYE